jgi:hypothetical protein
MGRISIREEAGSRTSSFAGGILPKTKSNEHRVEFFPMLLRYVADYVASLPGEKGDWK